MKVLIVEKKELAEFLSNFLKNNSKLKFEVEILNLSLPNVNWLDCLEKDYNLILVELSRVNSSFNPIQFIMEMKERYPLTKIIGLSSRRIGFLDKLWFISLGVDEVVEKPFDLEDLEKVLGI
jgi:DNA-binding response OmpR family regulator